MIKGKIVLVTGAGGFLGGHVVEKLKKWRPKKILTPSFEQHDLRRYEECVRVTRGVDIVIHLAANVGGIAYQKRNPGSIYYDNVIMATHLMEAARLNGVKKFLALGSVCAYPKITPVPFKEEYLWNGYPEETNGPYGIAKRMMLVQAQAYRRQYGFNAIFLMPVNFYGPGDHFDPETSHVIPALIQRFSEAKENRNKQVVVWGSGKPTREFLYIEDAAEGIALAVEKYNKEYPVNLGSSYEISIRDLANLIKKLVGYKGKIVFDKSKPDGQPRRKVDISKAKKEFGFEARTTFEEGLRKTINWYEENIKKNTKGS
ncbi:MAG: GDP-L-fucose synthase family protein [Patescibacteria group bacterium]